MRAPDISQGLENSVGCHAGFLQKLGRFGLGVLGQGEKKMLGGGVFILQALGGRLRFVQNLN